MKVSPASAPASETLTPGMAVAAPSATLAFAGAVMTGVRPGVVTAIDRGAPESPRLSLTLKAIVSGVVRSSVSVSVAKSAFTWASVPATTRCVVPAPETPAPFADSSPKESLTTTVKVSPAIAPVSVMPTPAIAVATPSATLAFAGAVMTGVRPGW